jgi:hypothetical protein
MIRIKLGHPSKFSFALSGEQEKRLKCLIDTLLDMAASRRQRMISYHDFMWSLIDYDPDQPQPQPLSEESWGDAMQRAIWLKALREDGNFYGPTDFTPDLSKLKYLSYMTSLLEALLDKDQDIDRRHADDIQ